jgi:hypothetical protein
MMPNSIRATKNLIQELDTQKLSNSQGGFCTRIAILVLEICVRVAILSGYHFETSVSCFDCVSVCTVSSNGSNWENREANLKKAKNKSTNMMKVIPLQKKTNLKK